MPDGGASRCLVQFVAAALFVGESERFASPAGLRLVFLQPVHAENDVEVAQHGGDEVELVGVGADSDQSSVENSTRRRAVPVCDRDGVGVFGKREAVSAREGR